MQFFVPVKSITLSVLLFLCNKIINFLLLLIDFTVTTLWVSCHALKFFYQATPLHMFCYIMS